MDSINMVEMRPAGSAYAYVLPGNRNEPYHRPALSGQRLNDRYYHDREACAAHTIFAASMLCSVKRGYW